ncbi:cyclic-phosphate processing receiver domain-containing protein [Lysinibacillus telephonicus]
MNKEFINLYVDDLRDCPLGFTIARNVEEAIITLKTIRFIYSLFTMI